MFHSKLKGFFIIHVPTKFQIYISSCHHHQTDIYIFLFFFLLLSYCTTSLFQNAYYFSTTYNHKRKLTPQYVEIMSRHVTKTKYDCHGDSSTWRGDAMPCCAVRKRATWWDILGFWNEYDIYNVADHISTQL